MNNSTKENYTDERVLIHDIINELSIIKMAMFLGKKKVEDPTLLKYMADSEDAVKKIEDLVQNYRHDHSL